VFAGAAREVVFANPAVVHRINEDFIPVALKAAMVNNPPPGIEGELYAEIGRSKPAPQGICTANSAGKVLAWALSFDNDKSILQFLDHVLDRYRQSPNAENRVTAERFMRFPSRKLANREDTAVRVIAPEQHPRGDRCPATPKLERGTLVGRIVGRVLDHDGNPVADTIGQEHYMEARFEIPVDLQELLAAAVKRAEGKQFKIPDALAGSIVTQAFLGQLDVNPMGSVPGSRNDSRSWEFSGQTVPSDGPQITRVHIIGKSSVEGGQDGSRTSLTDGRLWEHRVVLAWQGYVDISNNRMTQLVMIAGGDERLRWGNARFNLSLESDVQHLMAGHAIDFDGRVRYGLTARPCSSDEVAEDADGKPADPARIRTKVGRLQIGLQRLRRSGGDRSEIAKLMKDFGPLMQKQQMIEAESVLDQALKLLEQLLEDNDGETRDR